MSLPATLLRRGAPGVVLAMAVAGLAVLPTASSAASPVTVSLSRPAAVQPGDEARVEVRLEHADDVAAIEISVGLDTAAAGSAATLVMPGPLAGRALRALPTAVRPDGVTVGLLTCEAEGCATGMQPQDGDAAAVASLVLQPQAAGRLQLRVQRVTAVDRSGHELPVRVEGGSRVLAVGDGAAVPAPAAAAASAGRADDRTTPADGVRLRELGAAWHEDRLAAASCAPARSGRDDGCVDVGDLQALATSLAQESTVDARLVATTTATSTTYVVDSTEDLADASTTDLVCRTSAGTCTLRAAISQANAHKGADVIAFAIPGTGPFTLAPATRYPYLSDPSGVTIDGYTQPGAAVNSSSRADNAKIMIHVKGTGGTGIDGFLMTGAYNTLRGLALSQFKKAVWMLTADSHDNVVVGSFLGIDPVGGGAQTKVADQSNGVVMQSGAHDNVIGRPTLADRNVASGNGHHGVVLVDGGTTRNTVQNNIIGLSPDGSRAIANQSHGIDINSYSQYTTVGGDGALEGNVVSGNLGEGVEISHGSDTYGNTVVGNLIGTTLDGSAAPLYAQNGQRGVHIEGGPPIKGPNLVRDNVIVNNKLGGVLVDRGAEQATITRNRIGVTSTGVSAPNGSYGVRLQSGATKAVVGPDNIIAGNKGGGVEVLTKDIYGNDVETAGNTITRNSIRDNTGPGIDLEALGAAAQNDAGDADTGANTQLNWPEVTRATATSVSGTACASCVVEAFLVDAAGTARGAAGQGSGATYLASGTAGADGAFTVPLSGAADAYVTLTATSPAGDTSEFSRNTRLPAKSGGNLAPTARATASCDRLTCTFSGATSSDPDGRVFAWA